MSALDKVAALIEARYLPKPRRFETEIEGRFIGGSTIVKEKAADYAAKVLANHAEENNDEMRYYSYRGNSLGDSALADFPYKEVRIEASLRDRLERMVEESVAAGRHDAQFDLNLNWVYRGHADAVFVSKDGGVCVIEHKSHTSPTPHKVDMAFRQGASYLAVMALVAEDLPRRSAWPQAMGTACEFYAAREAGRSHNELFLVEGLPTPLLWLIEPMAYRPEGVVVAVAPYNPPAAIKKFPLTAEQLAQVRDFVLDKAATVAYAAITGDLHYARKWDEEHPTEFLVPFSQIDDGIPELDDIGRQLAEQLAILTPKGLDEEALDAAEKEVKRLRALADLAMAKSDVKRGVFGGVSLTRVVVSGKEVPAKPAGWQDGFSYVKSRLVKE